MPVFMEFRCILFLDTSESGVYVESRCIWNIWFFSHTSEMPDLGPVRCIIALVSIGDTSGLRFQCPSRCMEVQIYLNNTSGWANIGYFRCIASNRQNKIHRNSVIHTNPDAFQLISRDATSILSQHTPAQAGKNKQNTSEFNNFFQSRCISINFPRCYLYSLAAYSRASQLQINFPRIYLHPLAAYSRANQPHFNLPRFSCLTYGLGQFFMALKTSSLRSRARSFIRGFAPEDESMVDIILLLIS